MRAWYTTAISPDHSEIRYSRTSPWQYGKDKRLVEDYFWKDQIGKPIIWAYKGTPEQITNLIDGISSLLTNSMEGG